MEEENYDGECSNIFTKYTYKQKQILEKKVPKNFDLFYRKTPILEGIP